MSATRAHYRVPRALVHALVLVLLLGGVLLIGGVYTQAPRLIALSRSALDAEAPLTDPDVVVLHSDGRSDSAERYARDFARGRGPGSIALIGEPFAPDELAPSTVSVRVPRLLALGVPRSSIVEIYKGDELWEMLDAFHAVARERGWRRVLFLSQQGGSKRQLLGATRLLGGSGIAVGQAVFSDGTPEDPVAWWRDPQERTVVVYNWLLLAFGSIAGRY